MDIKCSRLWAEIDLSNIIHNYMQLRKKTGCRTILMAVVKANAYGHGAVPVAKALVAKGVDRLAVATLDEAIELRAYGIGVPIDSDETSLSIFSMTGDMIVTYPICQGKGRLIKSGRAPPGDKQEDSRKA